MRSLRNVLAVALLIAVIFVFAGCHKNSPAEIGASSELGEEMQNVAEQISDVIDNNADAGIDEFEIPDESCFMWEDSDSGAVITGYNGTQKSVEIPATLGGKPVCAIGEGAFANSEIIAVRMPDGVEEVNNEAFYFCQALQVFEAGNGLKRIGDSAFEGCFVLSNISLGNSLEEIGDMAFSMCACLQSVLLPDTLKELKGGAFCMCGLTEITIPGSVEVIETQAFTTCEAMEKAVILDGCKSIESRAFETCSALHTIKIPGSIEEMGANLFINDHDVEIIAPAGSAAADYAGEYEIPFHEN